MQQECMTHAQEKRQLIRTKPEEARTLDLLNKDIKLTSLNMLKGNHVQRTKENHVENDVSSNREYQ